jgi:hypothetical protein
MANYVCSGATLKCSMGDSTTKLTVLPHRGIRLNGQPLANVSDYQPFVNITLFGQCQSLANPNVAGATAANWGVLRKMPCMPNITSPWLPGRPNVIVQDKPALMDTCKLFCIWAGIIEITDDGQTEAYEKIERENRAKKPEVWNIYYLDETGDKRFFHELYEGNETTLCIEVVRGHIGKRISLTIEADEGKTFIGGKTELTFSNLLIEKDDMAYIRNFKVEYENTDEDETDS